MNKFSDGGTFINGDAFMMGGGVMGISDSLLTETDNRGVVS